MVIEDFARNDMGSDHNLLWYEIRSGSMEVRKRIRLK